MKRRRRSRVSNLAAGFIAIAVIGIACYYVFGGSWPFTGKQFVLKAMFTSQTQLHIPSPVRIAGVDVGQVVSVQRASGSSNAAVVTMDINKNGLPIHANANAKIRPRLFVEGNFYVDLFPGTPNAPARVVGRHAGGRAERGPGAARPRARGADHPAADQPADAASGVRRLAGTRAGRRRRTPPRTPASAG